MKNPLQQLLLPALLAFLILCFQPSAARAQNVVVTYQGRVTDNGTNFTGTGRFKFALVTTNGSVVTYWSNDGTSVGGSQPASAVTAGVNNGLFTIGLGDTSLANMTSLSAALFGNSNLQLQIWFSDGVNGFAALNPPQSLTTTPFAAYAGYANGLTGLTVQTNTNGAPNLIGGSPVNYVAGGVIGATIGGGGAVNNGGTAQSNSVTASFGTVSGGAGNAANNTYATVAGGSYNTASGQLAVIGGGTDNTVTGQLATVGGGLFNFASGAGSTVAGGVQNSATNTYATVGGGDQNTANDSATVGGGYQNTASGSGSTLSGGSHNFALALYSTVGGGYQNSAGLEGATVGGGEQNTATNIYATVGGGSNNTASGSSSTVSGGVGNSATNTYATVGGGYQNIASSPDATVAGGSGNTASGNGATVSGGSENKVAGINSTVGGGAINIVSGSFGTVAGGSLNTASGDYAAVAGGHNNTATNWATVAGGEFNLASGNYATVAGGLNNTAGDLATVVAGGINNSAGGYCSAVPGGYGNTASGIFSFAAGYGAVAAYDGDFVWADSQGGTFTATVFDQFLVRAQGGVGIGTASPSAQLTVSSSGGDAFPQAQIDQTDVGGFARLRMTVSGNYTNRWDIAANASTFVIFSGQIGANMIQLNSSGLTVHGTFVSSSDRNLKENFHAVDPAGVLDRVAALPISNWNYKDDAGTRHIGPMAQDFYAAFNVGPDDKHITTIDEGGVALAAIQGLNEKLEAKAKNLEAENAELKARLDRLERLVAAADRDFPQKPR